MPISTISQNISTIPEAGHRGVDVQTQFVIKQEDFQDHLQGTTVTELNALKTQINTTVSGMNDAVITINTKAGEASTSALNASNSASTATTKAGEASTSASQASVSATKASQWADNNYNVEVETGKYSAKHWSTVAQNTVNNKVDKVTSTDNAIVRFNGSTGAVQNSGIIIDDNNNIGVGTSTLNKGSWGKAITLESSTNEAYELVTNGVYMASLGAGGSTVNLSTYGAIPLLLGTNGTERMRIGTNGNIGINKADGSYKVDIKGNLAINASIFGHYFVNYQDGKDIDTDYGAHMLVTGDAGTTQKAYRIGTKFNSGDSDYVFEYSTNTQSYGSDPSLLTFSEKMRLKSNGSLLLTSGTGGLGYGTGAGGTVTQLTSKSTAVTLNKPTGMITMNNAALAAGASVVFSLSNTIIQAQDYLFTSMYYGTANPISYRVESWVNGTNSSYIRVTNITGGSLSETPTISFAVIKGAQV